MRQPVPRRRRRRSRGCRVGRATRAPLTAIRLTPAMRMPVPRRRRRRWRGRRAHNRGATSRIGRSLLPPAESSAAAGQSGVTGKAQPARAPPRAGQCGGTGEELAATPPPRTVWRSVADLLLTLFAPKPHGSPRTAVAGFEGFVQAVRTSAGLMATPGGRGDHTRLKDRRAPSRNLTRFPIGRRAMQNRGWVGGRHFVGPRRCRRVVLR